MGYTKIKEQYNRCMPVNATRLLKKVHEFKKDSEKGIYYEAAPSKNAVTAHGEVAKTINSLAKNLAQLRVPERFVRKYTLRGSLFDQILSKNMLFMQNELIAI